MFDLTCILTVFAFLLIAVIFLIMSLVLRANIVKQTANLLDSKSNDSAKDAFNIIESTKKLLWYLGITYLTIALAMLLEGAWGIFELQVFNNIFIICGVILFLFGVFLTAYGVLAMFNTNDKKFGVLRKSTLATICNLADGKKLLVLVPNTTFGEEAVKGAEKIDANLVSSFRMAHGKALDFCVVEDASAYKIGVQYLMYSSMLRVKYQKITISFVTEKAFDASVSNIEQKAEPAKEKPAVVAAKAKKEDEAVVSAENKEAAVAEKPAKKAKKPTKKAEKPAKKAAAKKAEKTEKPVVEKKTKKVEDKNEKAAKPATKAQKTSTKAQPKAKTEKTTTKKATAAPKTQKTTKAKK
ncbi:MAG: hypothetical protein IJU58_00200 [Clostridia bacterium]|nr:hypothetical protein [Clostridia bacterium]